MCAIENVKHVWLIQVLMRVEQEQKVTEDALRKAEQDANNQKYEVQVLRVPPPPFLGSSWS